MKNLLNPYLNRKIRIDDSYSGLNNEYTLFRVADTYFGITENLNEPINRFIPYTSVSQIVERNSSLTISVYNFDELMEIVDSLPENIAEGLDSMKNDVNTLKEEIYNVKGCIIGNSVPLGELMRKSREINDELNEINNKMDDVKSRINSVETAIRYIR